ncbi:NAD(P)/FAD-dependent oxidoreductase, partial [Pantoea sp. SIMBA_079]
PGDALRLDLLPGRDALAWLQAQQAERPGTELKNVLADLMPRRFAQRLCEVWIANRPMKQYTPPQLQDTAALLQAWPLVASGT